MNNFGIMFAAAAALAATAGIVIPADASQDNPQRIEKADLSGLRDFDFLVGDWRVQHRRLKERLANSHEWQEFDGTCSNRALMDGWGNVDDNADQPAGRQLSRHRPALLRREDRAVGHLVGGFAHAARRRRSAGEGQVRQRRRHASMRTTRCAASRSASASPGRRSRRRARTGSRRSRPTAARPGK